MNIYEDKSSRVVIGAVSCCLLILFWGASCSEKGPNVLDQDDVVLAETIGANSIYFHKNTADVDSLRGLIVDKIKLAIESISKVVEVKDVKFRVMVFPERTIPKKGMSGAAPNGEHIYVLLDPSHPRLEKSLTEELVATIAHEYHHTLRHRTVGYSKSLFESMVSEGLADHFSIEVTGIDPPPWFTPFTESELAPWREKAEQVWFDSEFDYLAWFVGLNSDIPRGVGYAISFQIVSEYLQAHGDESPATLYATVADDFLPKDGPNSNVR